MVDIGMKAEFSFLPGLGATGESTGGRSAFVRVPGSSTHITLTAGTGTAAAAAFTGTAFNGFSFLHA